jgi:nucleoside-diphosphate-sugar epimerase
MSLPAEDLEYILKKTEPLWAEFRDKSVFLTGGTGFVGTWLLQSFLYANHKYDLRAKISVLSRDSENFLAKHPQLKNVEALRFIQGDVREFKIPDGPVDFVIHAALDPAASAEKENALESLDVSYSGTRRVLELCRQKKISKYLYVSSGAVYGPQTAEVSNVEETSEDPKKFEPGSSAYGNGKCLGEWLSRETGLLFDFEVKIARCFAFVGPELPLDGHYAVGNFIRDVLSGTDIRIKGSGMQVRSYMYAADMAVWLWTILLKGKAGEAYNVGSSESRTLRQLAETLVETQSNKLKIHVENQSSPNLSGSRYVPSTRKARHDLDLDAFVNIESALQKTLTYYKTAVIK